MHGIKAKLNNQPVILEIKYKKLYITNSDLIIPLSDINSLKTKNEEGSSFLMIITKNNNKQILEFSNYNVRDLCKSLLLSSINDAGTYKEISYDTNKFVASLSPPLLSLFSDLNCTISQFYNYFMQSNFYDVRNKPTFLDRLITEKLRETKSNLEVLKKYVGNENIQDPEIVYNKNESYNEKSSTKPSLTRINNYSLLLINEETTAKPFVYTPKEVNFKPVYDIEQDSVDDTETLDLEIEQPVTECTIEKKVLKKILEISKKIYKKQPVDDEAYNFLNQYKDIKYLQRLIYKNKEE